MPMLLNNCRNRCHAAFYPSNDGMIAFFDLETEGRQATQAVSLPKGTECIVVSKPIGGLLRFQTFRFEREEVRQAPTDETGLLRVFFGRPFDEAVEMTQKQAAASGPFTRFFDVRGHFKRASVIASG